MELHSLTLILSLFLSLQVLVLLVQYRLNRTESGLGWWVAASSSLALASLANLLRDHSALGLAAVVANNFLLILAMALFLAGTRKFLGAAPRYGWLLLYLAVFTSLALVFTLVQDNLTVRRVNVSVAMAGLSFLLGGLFWKNSLVGIRGSARFLAVVFFFYACSWVLRGASPLFDQVGTLFTPSMSSTTTYLSVIVASTLWTNGFILLVNQRLNSQIREEIAKRHQIFNTSPDAVLITRSKDGHLVEVNDGFTEMTGYARAEIEGKTTLDLGVWYDPQDRLRMVELLEAQGSFANFEAVILRKDGTKFTAILSSSSLTVGGQKLFSTVVRDISDRKADEQKIRSLLAEKEILLKEVHHRIKNNMGTIQGLLFLQAQTLKDPVAVAALEDAQNRILSMTILYEKLYNSSEYRQVSVGTYFPELVDQILAGFPQGDTVRVEKKVDDFLLDADRMQPLGIIVNELLTNIMKYAFRGVADPMVRIELTRVGSKSTLVLSDNGTGLPETVDFDHSTGFGLTLIRMLTQQIEGTIRIERQQGTRIVLEF